MRIVRKELVSFAAITGLRYDEATQTVQTFDGENWIDSPDSDPRQINHYPPPDTANPRCDGAARMVALLQEQEAIHEQGLQEASFGSEVLSLILLSLAFIPLINVVAAVIISLYAQLIVLGYAAVHAAFDGFDWAGLKCKIYANVNADGFITDAGLLALSAAITASYTANQAFVLNGILGYVGRAGMNDAAAIRTETGDCSACPNTWVHTFQADDPRFNWSFPYSDNMLCNNQVVARGVWGQVVYESGLAKWKTQNEALFVGGRITLPEGSTLTKVDFAGHVPEGSYNLDSWQKWKRWDGGVNCYGAFYADWSHIDVSVVGPTTFNWLFSMQRWGGAAITWVTDWIRVSGTGVDPYAQG